MKFWFVMGIFGLNKDGAIFNLTVATTHFKIVLINIIKWHNFYFLRLLPQVLGRVEKPPLSDR